MGNIKRNRTFELIKIIVILLFITVVSEIRYEVSAKASERWSGIPAKGMVTMVDLGANSCVPCKMMAPILEKVEKDFRGKAAVIVIDVWKDRDQAKRFGVRAIPTQIFFDKDGREIYRHVGFMPEAEIVAQLKKMGVE
ncbi:MAG: thioredoxin [Desulfobacteraceae bacterium]|jgi:thioredoxin 1|nr:MAG: thioredoxin [Desulfobacteraceae bacterium]